ncbi:MAG: serine/threonine-protein kinase [Myxococcota bacterium]
MACLDETQLLALVEGTMSEEDLREIDGHLDTCDECRETIATLTSGEQATTTRRQSAGDHVGRYRLEEEIGRGAMGVVFRAHDPELDRLVAVKVLHDERNRPRDQARLLQEAQAMARLSHPHVVTVYDVGIDRDSVFIAMELVDGPTLRRWLATHPDDQDSLFDLLLQAGEGLHHAHEAGLVHRDFKPDNVLVANGQAKVTDFGLAGAGEVPEEAAPTEALGLTQTGALLGTPAYMAPEQLRGEPATARSDQFAFAVTAWEMLTGSRPFEGATLRELRSALEDSPSGAPPHPALGRALEPDPEARFSSMDALLHELRPRPRPRAVWRLAAVVVGAAMVGGAALGLGVFDAPADPCGASHSAIEESWNPGTMQAITAAFSSDAVAQSLNRWAERWTAARVDACEATHVRHEQSESRLDARIACLDNQRIRFDAFVTEFSSGDADHTGVVEALRALAPPESCATGEARNAPAELLQAETRLALTIRSGHVGADDFEALDRLESEARAGAADEVLGRLQLLRAEAELRRARYDDAASAARAALLTAEPIRADRIAAEAWLVLLRVAGEQAEYGEAERHAEHAMAVLRRTPLATDLLQRFHHARALVRMNKGDLEGAAEDLEKAEDALRDLSNDGDPQFASLATSHGNLARLQGDFEASLAHHQHALDINRAALGPSHLRVGRNLHNIAGILRRLSRTEEARIRYQEALAIKEEALADHPEIALTHNSLGLLAFDDGNDEEARSEFEASLAIFARHQHADAAMVRYNLALVALREERFEDAKDALLLAIAADERRLGSLAKRVGVEQLALGKAWLGLGEPARADLAFARVEEVAAHLEDAHLLAELGETRHAGNRTDRSGPRRDPEATPMRTPETDAADPETPIDPPPELEAPADATRPAGSGVYGAGQAWDQ